MKNVLFSLVVAVVFSTLSHASDVVFPHVASGPLYLTELKITNQETANATVVLSFFTPKGEVTDIFYSVAGPLQIPPLSTVSIRLAQPVQDTAGWARARSSSTITGVLQISFRPSPGVTSSSSFDRLGFISTARINGAAGDNSRKTAIAVCNPSTEPLLLDLELFDMQAVSLGRLSWVVARHNQRALYLEELGIPGAHSVELISKSGLFSAISVSQNSAEISTNQVTELIQRRFVLQQEKLDLSFSAYQIKARGGVAVVTGSNGVSFIDLNRKIVLATVPLETAAVGETIAFHPFKPLVAVGGVLETILIDTNTMAVTNRLPVRRASVAFDDLTGTLVTAVLEDLGVGLASRFTTYGEGFQPIATTSITHGPGRIDSRNGLLAANGVGGQLVLFRLPSLEIVANKLLQGASAYFPRISGDNIVVLGPEIPNVSPANNLLTLYYIDSARMESIHLGEPVDTKVVQKERVYLTRNNKLIVVDLLQRAVIQTFELDFSPGFMGFYPEANALIAVDQNSLRILRLVAQ